MSSSFDGMAQPRLLFTLPNLNPNGVVKQTLATAEALARTGRYEEVALYVLSPQPQEAHVTSSMIATIHSSQIKHRRPLPRRVTNKINYWSVWSGLRKAAARADIVFSAFEFGAALALPAEAARKTGRRFCIVVHNNICESIPDYAPSWPIERTMDHFASADRIICVSRGLQAQIEDLLGERTHPPLVSTVPNGVDLALLDRKAEEAPSHDAAGKLVPESPYFLAIGRLTRQKGFDLLIRAHAHARRLAGQHHLFIAGGGPETIRDELVRLAESLCVSDSVHFLGHCENPLPLLKAASAFCLASRYEGYPLTLVEACALGTPVIASDCIAGPREVLDHGRYGDLVPVGDSAGFGEAMAAHIRNPQRLQDKANASYRERNRLCSSQSVTGYARAIRDLFQAGGRDARI